MLLFEQNSDKSVCVLQQSVDRGHAREERVGLIAHACVGRLRLVTRFGFVRVIQFVLPLSKLMPSASKDSNRRFFGNFQLRFTKKTSALFLKSFL